MKINNPTLNSTEVPAEIKGTRCFNRLVLLVVLPGLTNTFTACSSDDDSDIPAYSFKGVDRDYSGKMLTETVLSVNPQNRSSGEEQPQGVTVAAEVKDSRIMTKKFPVDDLIRNIIGEEAAEVIVENLDDINYNIPYTATFDDDGRGSTLLQLKPEPLKIEYTPPT